MIRKTKSGRFEVAVYNPAIAKKAYIGTYAKRGAVNEAGTARHAEAEAERRFAGRGRVYAGSVAAAVDWWLSEHPRPEATTNRHNANNLKMLTAEYGDRRVDNLTKKEAARIAEARPHVGATASAMYNDLIRYMDGFDSINPFAKLVKEGQGRKNITPLTETEVRRLGDVAVEEWGLYGANFRAWILFSAWTGCRPGEVAGLQPADLNFADGLVHVQRQRRIDGVALPKTKETREIILPAAAADAVKNMPTQGIEWVFTTSSCHPFGKGSWNYYWRPVRDAFTRELPASHWLPQRLAVDPKDKLEIYELRHFCGSLLADRGATARDIAEQLGNTAEVCERTYIHPYQNRVRARLRAAFDQPEAPESADQIAHEDVS